jgi:hypothetical protein
MLGDGIVHLLAQSYIIFAGLEVCPGRRILGCLEQFLQFGFGNGFCGIVCAYASSGKVHFVKGRGFIFACGTTWENKQSDERDEQEESFHIDIVILESEKEMLHFGEEQIMARIVQVSGVAGSLEVQAAELLVPYIDAAVAGGVENRDAVRSADFKQDGSHFGEHFPWNAPRSDETKLCTRVFCNQAFAQDNQFLPEQVGSLTCACHKTCIVVTGQTIT